MDDLRQSRSCSVAKTDTDLVHERRRLRLLGHRFFKLPLAQDHLDALNNDFSVENHFILANKKRITCSDED